MTDLLKNQPAIRRLAAATPFAAPPQQSDYAVRWTGKEAVREGPAITRRQQLARFVFGSKRQAVFRVLPPALKRLLVPRYNPRYFTRVSLAALRLESH